MAECDDFEILNPDWNNFLWHTDWVSIAASEITQHYSVSMITEDGTQLTYIRGDSSEYDFMLLPEILYWFWSDATEPFTLNFTDVWEHPIEPPPEEPPIPDPLPDEPIRPFDPLFIVGAVIIVVLFFGIKR